MSSRRLQHHQVFTITQVNSFTTFSYWSRNIRIPDPVASFLESLPQKPAAYIQKPTKMIRLTTPALQAIFEPIINAIDTLVSDQITANRVQGSKQFDYIFLVGGFGSSQLLFKHLKTKFSPLVHKVIQPANPGMAVISGAVLLGKDPSLIRTRRARATYGTASGVPFIAGTHDEKRKFTTEDGEEFCMDVFCKFVCVGDEIEVDKAVVCLFLLFVNYYDINMSLCRLMYSLPHTVIKPRCLLNYTQVHLKHPCIAIVLVLDR